ncbi:preprotein translocase subunit SecD [Propionibacterium cyclohexanicum]|uniref:Protein translocase subunit SecD n=1 Tax=Propionibacterium cyclohexanicum TaxID=64702 RepID=A0A1H9Q4L1_9ACTN|nr:protein translocase subunit SecD [Propionibacterium cyclohexanicum]SER54869.1 preprotein translocase subunit SecD [Propionibacterium cyclohexanicum]
MARTSSPRHAKPGRRLIVFALILVALYGLMALSKTWAPRLGLDLRGGTTITLTAHNNSDGSAPSKENLETARTIIQKRVDALGVGESSVTLQGDRQIQVAVPNVSNDELVQLVGTTAQLAFRNVYSASQSQSATSSPSASVNPTAPVTSGLPPSPTPTPTPQTAPATAGLPPSPTPTPTPRPTAPASAPADFSTLLNWQPSAQDDADFDKFRCGDAFPNVPDQPLFACSEDGTTKYLLGPELISGTHVTNAQAEIPQGEVAWVVSLEFDSAGADRFSQATTHLAQQSSPMNQFAIVLDGKVISAPSVSSAITGGSAQISGGNINATTSKALANELKFGALPVSFDVSSVDSVSASLGGDQLQAGLIAGLIGLGLVIVYSFLYYRGLGIVVVGSLGAAALVTWAVIVLLGATVGFAMNLPGIAGAIVAIGVTADSFIVYFERIRDEIRDGFSLPHSIQSGWGKARGTIVMADAVQLLSAVVLFILAIGEVKGFAFTLGVTTAIDLFVVFFFTHPLVTLLGRTHFFGTGQRFSGFEPEHLGVSRASLLGRRRTRQSHPGGGSASSGTGAAKARTARSSAGVGAKESR